MENQKYSQKGIDMFWNGFLKETNRIETTKYLDIFHFELTKRSEFKEYIAKGDYDLRNDGITFAVSSFYATDEEYQDMMKKMGGIIQI